MIFSAGKPYGLERINATILDYDWSVISMDNPGKLGEML